MKLYTREQMIEAFNYGQTLKGFDWIGDMIDSLEAIELPTDEEIDNASLMISNDRVEFIKGAKWVIEQIKNKVNENNNY